MKNVTEGSWYRNIFLSNVLKTILDNGYEIFLKNGIIWKITFIYFNMSSN